MDVVQCCRCGVGILSSIVAELLVRGVNRVACSTPEYKVLNDSMVRKTLGAEEHEYNTFVLINDLSVCHSIILPTSCFEVWSGTLTHILSNLA